MKIAFTFLVVAMCHALGAEHESPALNDLTLERAIEIAISNHPLLAEAAANVEAGKARASAAGKLPNPEAIARTESAPISSGTTSRAEYVGGVSQTIPLAGRLGAAQTAELASVSARSRELELARFELVRKVRNAFATALFSFEVFGIQTNTAASLRELARVTKARVEAGDVASLDLARTQAEEAQWRLEVSEASRLHHEAMDSLASAMGDYRTPIASLSGSLSETLEIVAIREVVYAGNHPAVATSRSEVEAQEARVKLAKAERIPDLNFDLLYRRLQANRENAFDAGVRIAIPVFNRNKRVREAEHELRASEARLRRVQNEIGHEQHALELELQAALEAADLLKEEVLPKTELAGAAAEARYKAGDIPLSELLIIRREVAAAHLRYAEALRSVMQAWSGLRRN